MFNVNVKECFEIGACVGFFNEVNQVNIAKVVTRSKHVSCRSGVELSGGLGVGTFCKASSNIEG
jgi:hypothetical protein